MASITAILEINQLPSGHWCITDGCACNFVQLPIWPSNEAAIRHHAFAGASESFLLAVIERARMDMA
jgi:hypothetical protein